MAIRLIIETMIVKMILTTIFNYLHLLIMHKKKVFVLVLSGVDLYAQYVRNKKMFLLIILLKHCLVRDLHFVVLATVKLY